MNVTSQQLNLLLRAVLQKSSLMVYVNQELILKAFWERVHPSKKELQEELIGPIDMITSGTSKGTILRLTPTHRNTLLLGKIIKKDAQEHRESKLIFLTFLFGL